MAGNTLNTESPSRAVAEGADARVFGPRMRSAGIEPFWRKTGYGLHRRKCSRASGAVRIKLYLEDTDARAERVAADAEEAKLDITNRLWRKPTGRKLKEVPPRRWGKNLCAPLLAGGGLLGSGNRDPDPGLTFAPAPTPPRWVKGHGRHA